MLFEEEYLLQQYLQDTHTKFEKPKRPSMGGKLNKL